MKIFLGRFDDGSSIKIRYSNAADDARLSVSADLVLESQSGTDWRVIKDRLSSSSQLLPENVVSQVIQRELERLNPPKDVKSPGKESVYTYQGGRSGLAFPMLTHTEKDTEPDTQSVPGETVEAEIAFTHYDGSPRKWQKVLIRLGVK